MMGHRGRMEKSNSSGGGCMSEPEFFESSQQGRPSKARSEQRIVINGCSYGNQVLSPTSDDVDIFDSHCFATTPSSSNENRYVQFKKNQNIDLGFSVLGSSIE